MDVKESTNPLVQRELNRFRSLGGFVKVSGNTIILQCRIIPTYIAEAFAERLRRLDEQKKLEVVVQNKT